ncbi:MAG TPA: ABC transporter substrate-binding protein [Solirubrobacteraceae bacterium]|nr:ABC transporter substrate-binding protein [Solirubrobacteraceae bacterium]
MRTLLALVALVAAFGLAACGGGDESDTGGGEGGGTPAQGDTAGANITEQLFAGSAMDNRQNPDQGKKGGKLTVLAAGDVDYMDPGKTYYTYAIGIINATHRGLYAYLPGSTEQAVPDLADGDPQISQDGKTVTVKLKQGVMFSKPVSREVTSADVKYAIERAFTASVANGYARVYFGDLVGAPEDPGPYRPIEGIETPDDQTIVFRLSKGTGAALAGALAMPISVPVPKDYALRYDRENPSTYDQHMVFTGPYMVENDGNGNITGYTAGKRIHLVRNPDYAAVDDFRPAYLDEIEISAGNEDTAVATRRILSGENMASGDLEPPSNQLKRLLETNKTELSVVPGGGWRMISMDTSRPPFDDINVRKAVIAGFDRVAARQQRGGEALGPIAQHFIPPGMAGFEESGGAEPDPEFDWLQNPDGDRALSAEYFRKAGMESGKYEGNANLLLVADNAEPERSIAQITEQQLREMGFQTTLRLVTRDTMFTRFCNVPRSEVNVCPSVGWAQDFADPQTMLDPTFNGNNIIETQNSNWPELDVPAINRAIEQAKLVTDPDERAQAWADVNRQIVAQAPSIPYMWDYQAVVASPNVRGVQNGYSTTWDWNFTSIR